VGTDDIQIEVITSHAKGQPSLKLWPGTRNGRKGLLVAKVVRPWGSGIRILTASVTVPRLHDLASLATAAWREKFISGFGCGSAALGFFVPLRGQPDSDILAAREDFALL
jgi:hypothetical protein